MRLGIDFGTTRTVVAYCDRGNYPVLHFNSLDGEVLDGWPSVVAERQGELRFGVDALAVSADATWTVIRSFKRVLSDRDARPDRQLTVGSTRLTVLDLLTRFFAAMRDAIRERSNLPAALAREEELLAVVATPANALGAQRFLTLDAFRRAGFQVLATLNEPSAAGFEYSHRHRNTLNARREHVVVYDLGGGTFDASLVKMTGRMHDAVTTAGLARLGGDDFDAVLLELVLEQAGIRGSQLSPRIRAHLTDTCREVKERLNPNSRRIVVELDSSLGADSPVPSVTLPVADYYTACAPLVEKTVEAMSPIMTRLDKETKDEEAELSPELRDDIAGIYVVGGASALPIVSRMLRERFGRRVHRSPYPSAATAVGLAIASDREAGFELSDRFSRMFGVFREQQSGKDVGFDPIFSKDTRVPRAEEGVIEADRFYRPVHNLGHFRFVECTDLDATGAPLGDISLFADVHFPFDRGLQQSDADLSTVAVRRLPHDGPTIRERYTLDAHGLVCLTITDLGSSFERVYRIG